ncbi:MAG: MlaE family ABC transporter permease [Verrucomicrobiales bacterium]
MINPFSLLGRISLDLLGYLGQLANFAVEIVRSLIYGKFRWRLFFRQIVAIGFGSQLVVIVTGAFTGAVFAAQSYFKFSDFGVETTVGAVVSIAMCRELGPVLTGLMVAGRVGAAMAAEIGTMKVSEQIEALRALAVHPVDYLVVPRLLGMLVSIPLLIAEAILFGIIASHLVVVNGFGVPAAWFQFHLEDQTELEDIFIGMTKGFVFGFIIVLVSCHQGLKASHGAVGVGRATTHAVVISSLLILIVNLFLTLLLDFFFPLGYQ